MRSKPGSIIVVSAGGAPDPSLRPKQAGICMSSLAKTRNADSSRIVVVGLGYVGLPLAVALAKAHPEARLVGFDIDRSRIDELLDGIDRTGEVERDDLALADLKFTDLDSDCVGADIYIVTVPTPVDEERHPDMRPLL